MPVFIRAALDMRGYNHHRVSVCLCVCHTPVLYQNG